ncbi:MAG: ArV2 gp16 [Microbacterium sp.]|nr:ArV2 gp16 [Microbacterium sp.]
MPIVLAAPASTSGSGSSAFSPRAMTWTGWDGSVWPLTRPAAINPRLAPGVQGLHMPPMTIHKSSSPLVAGEDLLGYSLPARPVYWPLLFRAASAAEWEEQHGAFFDSFHPIIPGTWTVGTGSKARSLPLTGVFDGSYSFDRDPFVTGRALIGVELSAPRPLWRGRRISRPFVAAEGVDFIGVGGAPDFHISGAATFQVASIPNPGDEPAYLVWTVIGPLENVQLGVGDALIEVPFDIADGEVLQIDTDPAGLFATLDGVDVTRELGFQTFAPVPARGETGLVIIAGGAGAVTAELVPLYWRAF